MNVQSTTDNYKVAANAAIPFMGHDLSGSSGAITRHSANPQYTIAPQANDTRMAYNNSTVHNANTLVLAPGTYVVSYYVQGDTTGSTTPLAAGLRLIPPANQAAALGGNFPATLDGSRAQSAAACGDVSNTITITITTANTWLQLVNASSTQIEHGTSSRIAGRTWASLNIVKIA